jgi:hypothetical protein
MTMMTYLNGRIERIPQMPSIKMTMMRMRMTYLSGRIKMMKMAYLSGRIKMIPQTPRIKKKTLALYHQSFSMSSMN